MAKQRGPVASTFSGRVGNVVGAKMKGGEYVTRTYQPSVKNPNTLRQQAARFRMSVCSKVAAALAATIQIGYAMAAASDKLYPRSIFMKSVLPWANSPIATVGGSTELNLESMPMSKQAGINVVPAGELVATAGNVPAHATISNLSEVEVSGTDRAGVVYVFADENLNDVRTIASTNSTCDVPADMLLSYDMVHAWAYFKIAPGSKTEVSTDTYPWKYPSRTSACYYLGGVANA